MLALSCALAVGCSRPERASAVNSPSGVRGGDLIASVRTEPESFNIYAKRDFTTRLLSLLTHAPLARINAATQELEPWLAERWTRSADGLRYAMVLRSGLAFSDGTPLTSADVVFSVAAAYAEGSIHADTLTIGGQKLQVTALDPQTVEMRFPSPFGPGLRLLDNLPILPRHRLQALLDSGGFAAAWNTSTPPGEVVGLGPFVLSEYVPGQRLTFARNPHYFRTDERGETLPYLDRIVVEIVPDQDGQVLRLQSGQADTIATEVRPEDYALLKRSADAGVLQLLDLGTALDADSLWINLRPRAFAGDPRESWIQRDELREAISLAVNRQTFADTVFLGAAVPVFGPITPANKHWHSEDIPKPAYDLARAKALLSTVGLQDRDGDGLLEDARRTPARLTILTARGQTAFERGTAVIREELRKVGLSVDVVALEANALVGRFLSGEPYDAVYFRLNASDIDPALNTDFWLSRGGAHAWNVNQAKPATEWEREIDDLMTKQVASLDDAERRTLFVSIQKIFAAHQPMIYFAAPRVIVGASTRLTNLAPAISRPQLLWSADTIRLAR